MDNDNEVTSSRPLWKTVTLPGGYEMPMFGFGTWTIWSDQDKVYDAVTAALEVGYRFLDCAFLYDNELAVGCALADFLAAGTVTREEIFISTKLWVTHYKREDVIECMRKSLKNLQLDYVNLYLIHMPISLLKGDINIPTDESGNVQHANGNIVETWQGMEDVQEAGLTRNIGLCNFNSKQIQRIVDGCRIMPSNLQIEISPLFSQDRLISFCRDLGITITAYSPLGAPGRPWKLPGDPDLLSNDVLQEIASAKEKTPAQVCLRYILQRELIVIPKSLTPKRIKENIDIFDFKLTPNEMEKITGINQDFRAYEFPTARGHPEYPFYEPF